MNIYNENLHSNVVASLQSQELDEKKLQAQLDASMFTLYYAEGAEIFAREKLDATKKDFKKKQEIMDEMLKCSNLSSNLLFLANQQKSYAGSSAMNSSVMAFNAQIASNAILKLSADMGSVLSIVSAANASSHIHTHAKDAHALIGETAYEAEQISQMAMEVSSVVAELPSGSIADQAKATNDALNNLLGTASADLSDTVTAIEDDFAASAAASVTTKTAEGVIKYNKVEYAASKNAKLVNKKEQNLNLEVSAAVYKNGHGFYTVSFDEYVCPFANSGLPLSLNEKTLKHPVESYNIMVVKENRKNVFSMADAHDTLHRPAQFKSIPASEAHQAKKGVRFSISDLLDTDNHPLKQGDKYVIFLFVKLTEDYKKIINTFDNFLSAPSDVFSMKYRLHRAHGVKVEPTKKTPEKTSDFEGTFTVFEEHELIHETEYRCMLLPHPQASLTNFNLDEILKEVEIVEDIQEVATLEEEKSDIEEQLRVLRDKKTKGKKAVEGQEGLEEELERELKAIKARIAALARTTSELITEVKTTAKERNDGILFFDLKLAENVSAGNYTPAKEPEVHKHGRRFRNYLFEIDSQTTDNFGRPLINGNKYIPVILSYFNGKEEDRKKYLNSLSDWRKAIAFEYKSINQ